MATKPISDSMSLTDIRANLSEVVNEVFLHGRRVEIEKSGIPVAAVVSQNDIRMLESMDLRRKQTWERVQRVLNEEIDPFPDLNDDELLQFAVETVRRIRKERWEQTLADEESLAEEAGSMG